MKRRYYKSVHYRWRQYKYTPTKDELLTATNCRTIQEVFDKYNETGKFSSKSTIYRFIKHGLFEENVVNKFGTEVRDNLNMMVTYE